MWAQATIFSEWFLTKFMSYLNMKDIVAIDSAICNKSGRNVWLNCIAKDIGSLSTKIQPYLINYYSINWCSQKNIQFICLNLEFTKTSPLININ